METLDQRNFFSFAWEFHFYRLPASIGMASNLDRRYHALKGRLCFNPCPASAFRYDACHGLFCYLEACLTCHSTLRYHYQGGEFQGLGTQKQTKAFPILSALYIFASSYCGDDGKARPVKPAFDHYLHPPQSHIRYTMMLCLSKTALSAIAVRLRICLGHRGPPLLWLLALKGLSKHTTGSRMPCECIHNTARLRPPLPVLCLEPYPP